MENLFWLGVVGALIALLFAYSQAKRVKKFSEGTSTMQKIAAAIRKGANAYLKRQYKTVAIIFAVIAVILAILAYVPWIDGAGLVNKFVPFAFVTGGFYSCLAGFVGMRIATTANARTANAASESLNRGLRVAISSGSVMGFTVVGLGILDVSVWFLILEYGFHCDADTIANTMVMFGMGASCAALFARVGGGIFTKAADVGADLVGKVEAGIPEDDPRNPATIADNVGDNVGDVAGMGADLFDSNVAAMTSALVLATSLQAAGSQFADVAMVFMYAALGLISSIIGIATARIGKGGTPTKALNSSTYVTSGVFVVLTALATLIFRGFSWRIWGASTVGLVVGVIIGLTTDYFTDDSKPIVKKVAHASRSGSAFTVLSGVSYGFISALPAMIGIAVSALAAYKICEPVGTQYALFGIAMAAVGMLSIVGMIISNDAYGPIVDNARGLAEMGGLGEETIRIADELDSAGNTVKAVTKGFAIGAAGLTVISLLGAYMSEANVALEALGRDLITGFDIMNPVVFFGLLIGAAIPAVFSAMLILGVDKNAQRMVAEIHRQFREIRGLREGKPGVKPEYDRCIDIATSGALRELIPAGLMAIIATLLVGFIGGPLAIGGFLMGNIVSGLLLSLFMSNAGGLWDNSKKYVEAGNEGGKGSEAHKAAVVGDTVGDPFKDTAGPSINTQITVVSLVASLMSALFAAFSIFH